MCFIGVFKAAQVKLLSKYLGSWATDGRGEWVSMIYEGELDIGVLLWTETEMLHLLHLLERKF